MPLFSVIIPTFNVKDKLEITLQSLRDQDFSDLEIVVQDGNSADGTKEFLQNQSNIQWKSEADSGIYNAMNRAIALSKGQFLLFMGAGDTLRPGVLSQMAAQIEANKKRYTDQPLLIYGDVFWKSRNQVHGGRFSQWRFTQTSICHQAIFYERSIFELLGLYDERYVNSADYALNVRAWGRKDIRKVHIPLIVSDYEGGGISDTTVDEVFVHEVLDLIWANFSFPVRSLYLLRRRAPGFLKRLRRR
jgi:glycosyltransferase involved in cell wall biosynthesis